MHVTALSYVYTRFSGVRPMLSGEASSEAKPVQQAESLEERVEKLLESMKEWKRRPVVQVGKAIVELIKLPKRETSRRVEPEKLTLHIRLTDSFRGIFVVEEAELRDLLEVLNSRTVQDLVKAVDVVNRKGKIVEYKL